MKPLQCLIGVSSFDFDEVEKFIANDNKEETE